MTTPAETIRNALELVADACVWEDQHNPFLALTLMEAEVERLKKAPMKAHVVEVGALYGLLGICEGVLPQSHEDPERALGIIRDEVAKCKQALAQPGDAA